MKIFKSEEMAERPENYIGPNLNPDGLKLEPVLLANGTYALLANEMPKDNNGVITGTDAALVIDAGINSAVSRQIQDIASSLTDKPVRYLVNTTYHGDHTFGNAAFPPEVIIISSERNKQSMSNLAYEKNQRSGNLRGNLSALDDVTVWRKPDMTFSECLKIDLGGISVELWYFGPGNAPGDTVVYVPSARVAWTGNYLMAKGVPPMLLEGGTEPYIASLEKFKATLDVESIVPGHGPMGPAGPSVDNFIAYMHELHDHARKAIADGLDVNAAVDAFPMSPLLHPPAGITPDPNMKAMAPHLHRLNVMAEYRALTSKQETERRTVMNIDGNYKLNLDTPVGAQEGSMTLKADGVSLSGTLVNARGTTEFSGGTVKGDEVEFDTRIQTPIGRLKAHVTGKVEDGHFSGDAKLPLGTAHIEGDKVA